MHKSYITILLLSALLRLMFVFTTPHGKTVSFKIEGLDDEPSHYNYVKYLGLHKKFPVQTESVQSEHALEHNAYEYYQPPLYYTLCALMYPLLGDTLTLYWGRLLSFAFGMLLLIILIRLLQMLGFQRKQTVFALLFGSFQMSHVYFSSLLSNDSLSWLIGIGIMYTLLTLYQKSIENGVTLKKEDYAAALLLVVGMYVKSSLALFYIIYLFTALLIFLKNRSVKAISQRFALCCLAVMLVSPWYLRNYILYQSVIALETGFGPPGINCLTLTNIHTTLNATVKTWFFPMQHVSTTLTTKLVNYSGILLLGIHIVLVWKYFVGTIKENRLYQISGVTLFLAIVLYVLLMTKWLNTEGRFLLTAFAPIIIFLFPARMSRSKTWFSLRTVMVVEILFGYIYFIFV